jgi:plastocyanin
VPGKVQVQPVRTRWTRWRTVWCVAAASALVVVLASCGDDGDDTGTAAAEPPVSLDGSVNDHGTRDLDGGTELELELEDSYFEPTYVHAGPGSIVRVTLTNSGDAPHTFTIDGTRIDEDVAPGASATVDVELPDEGALAYYCRFHVGGGMQGAFVVSEGAVAAGSSPTTAGGGSGGFGY